MYSLKFWHNPASILRPLYWYECHIAIAHKAQPDHVQAMLCGSINILALANQNYESKLPR